MNLQDFGAIGELVVGIAVIASLIYLAMQVKQANVSTHRNMYAQAATAISEYWLELAKNDELYANFLVMLRAPQSLSTKNLDRAYLVMDSYLALMESYFLHNQQYGEQLSQERWGRILKRMLSAPGGVEYWRSRQFAFHSKFAAYLDGLVDAQTTK